MNCLVNHDSCSHPRPDDRRRPARVIAVGSLPDFSDVKLCCLSDLDRDFSYVTLSHCWGPSGLEMKLTAPVEKSLKERIPWDSLPKTFRDAILITRALQNAFGVKYIWIDALCILQDSPGDWDKEASNMADIYRHSFCNLAACVGFDSHSGLFGGRDPCSEHSCVVDATSIEGSTASFYKIENRMIYDTSVKASILATRAWVLQEVLLAPRVLYFTPQQWVWECATLCASEMAPNETLIGFTNKKMSLDAPFVGSYEQSPPLGADYRLYRVWMNTVNLYTSRKLTKARDKLVAISGLAKQMHAMLHIKDEYIAGLWRRNLILHMLWRISYGQRATRPQPYRAPTWSWASVDGTIYNHRTNLGAEERCTAIVEFSSPKMVYVTDDIFGQVESAEICMKGSLFKVDFEFNVRTADQLVSMALLQWQGKTFTKFGQDSTNLDFETSVNTKPESIFCLPIVSETYEHLSPVSKTYEQKHYDICLLLEPVTGKKGVYQRYGICDLVKAFDIIQEAKMFPLDEDLYVQAHREGIYTIVII